MSERTFLFRVDASPRVGGGHAMRCLTLANALAAIGVRSIFAMAETTPATLVAIEAAGHAIASIETSEACDAPGWEDAIWPVRQQEDQAEQVRAIARALDATDMIVDHYRLDGTFTRASRIAFDRIAVVDDLANRAWDCDFLLDQTAGRSPVDYRQLVPAAATILTGGSYALLRPQFAAMRPAALVRRGGEMHIRRVLVTMGSTDVDGITFAVVATIVAAEQLEHIDVVLAPGTPSWDGIVRLASEDGRIAVHSHVEDMASLMLVADVAVGAAGTTSWERAALGLPSIVLELADNQRFVAARLAHTGAALVIRDPLEIVQAMANLAASDRLAAMSAAAFALIDAAGAVRVIERLVGGAVDGDDPLFMREARPTDSVRLWLWRNDPHVRARSVSAAPIARSDHDRWFAAALADPARTLLVLERGGIPVASVRLDTEADGSRIVSIMVDPASRGGGIGGRALALACGWVDARCPSRLRAVIHVDNVASQRVFIRCGFVPSGEVSPNGFAGYERPKRTTPEEQE